MQYGLVEDYRSRSPSAPFPAQSSVLDERALLDRAVGNYRIPRPESCSFLTRGDADVYRVRTATDSYYLKVYRPPRTRKRCEAEARFVQALSSSGIPVVKAIPRQDGRYACQVSAPEGTRPLLLFEEAPPALPVELGEALLAEVGGQVALLHAAADRFQHSFGLPELHGNTALRERVRHASRFLSEPDRVYLDAVSNALGRILRRMPRQAPGFGLCHADLVLSNLRLAAGGAITLFDFGNAGETWRAYDLAVVHWSLSHRHRGSRDDLWPAFVQGYERVRPLPEGWANSLVVMLVLRQIGFLGGNCATLPLRLGTEPFESGFMEQGMDRLRQLVERAGMQPEG